MELGGFAENETIIDGSYEEYLAFNYCMAENYVDVMYDEDFDAAFAYLTKNGIDYNKKSLSKVLNRLLIT